MSPLLGSKHVDAGKHVPVSRDFLKSLEEQVRSLRPSWRVDEAKALMELVLKVEDAAGWIYRGEGAANIVLGYRGSSPYFVGKVIRVQKLSRNGSDSHGWELVLSAYERIIWKDIEVQTESMSKEVLGRLYVLNVMCPLLGSKHVDAGKHVHVSRDFLESLEEQVQSLRPSWRVDEAKVNVLCDSALLISDHSLFIHGSVREDRCIAVEIKPKCGFLPVSKFIAEDNFIKKCVSRFKMHQSLKFHKKEIGEISEYDPVDLFSGSKDRINRAMKSLYAIPQNNFRIFFNGSLLFGGLGGAMDNTKSKSMEAIDDELGVLIDAAPGLRLSRFLELVSVTILQSDVLVRLLNTQMLDLLDIEGAIHAYYNIISQPCMVCKELGGLSKKYFSLHSLSLEASVKIVRDFLIAATAKDCSLMISFRLLSGEMISEIDVVHLETTGQSFCYKAHFIDLDMKPLKKMVHYYKLDQEIVNFYKEMNNTSTG